MLDGIRAREAVSPEEAEKIQEDFIKLQGLLDYSVGITEFESNDYREATELFIRFNGTGKRLSKSDLANGGTRPVGSWPSRRGNDVGEAALAPVSIHGAFPSAVFACCAY